MSRIRGRGANTGLTYQYRDASNYKQNHTVVFSGAISDEQLRRLEAHLDEGTYFIAEQVGLPNLRERWDTHYDDDHVWHELELDEDVELTDAAPTDARSVAGFVDAFVATDWDEAAAIERLERWKRSTPEGR